MSANVEADWVTGAGLRAAIVIHPSGHRCGYVGVPEGNQYHGKDYNDVDADVHGGLTFAGGSEDYPVANKGLWWLGYDCAHLYDARDPELMSGEYKELYDKGMLRAFDFDEGSVIRTLEYCVSQCESLAKQLLEETA